MEEKNLYRNNVSFGSLNIKYSFDPLIREITSVEKKFQKHQKSVSLGFNFKELQVIFLYNDINCMLLLIMTLSFVHFKAVM